MNKTNNPIKIPLEFCKKLTRYENIGIIQIIINLHFTTTIKSTIFVNSWQYWRYQLTVIRKSTRVANLT